MWVRVKDFSGGSCWREVRMPIFGLCVTRLQSCVETGGKRKKPGQKGNEHDVDFRNED